MKKTLFSIFMAVVLFSAMNVKAMTESELKEKLTKSYTINGETVKASDSQIVEIERYLQKYEVTPEDADYISKKFDEVLKIAQDSKAVSFTDLPGADKKKIVSIVADISDKTSVKATLTEGGTLTIFEKDGKTPFTIITDKDNGIKNTNSTNIILIIASVISLLGVAVVTKQVVKTNA